MLSKIKLPKIELSSLKQLTFIFKNVFGLAWRADKYLLLLSSISGLLLSATLLPNIYLDKLFIDTIIASIGKTDITLSLKTLIWLATARLSLKLFNRLLLAFSELWDWALKRKFSNYLESLSVQQYSSLDVSLIENGEFKDRFSKITRIGTQKAFELMGLLSGVIENVGTILSSLSIFVFFKPQIAVIILVLAIPRFFTDSKLAKDKYKQESRLSPLWRIRGQLASYLITTISYLELRILQISPYLVSRFQEISNKIFEDNKTLNIRGRTNSLLTSIPRDIFVAGLEFYLVYQAIIQKITIGSSQAYVRAVSSFDQGVRNLNKSMLEAYESYLYVSDLVWFLNLQPSHRPLLGNKFPRKIKFGIEFDHVWFKYPESNNWILKDVNFKISTHENIALIGENGVGKTTLVKLLANFYNPTKGKIFIDGLPISRYKPSGYWKNLAVLFQDIEDYGFTARDSIGYGNVTKLNSQTTIRKFAKLSGIDDWIMSLPLKYENPLMRGFQHGVVPSQGQWQRIGIARALIKDAQIIVLDEPTSNVDPQAEEDIFREILKLGKEKILVFISHRFSTVRRADKILVLDNGTITEQGSHDQLMKLDGKYAHLFNLQAKSYQ